MSRSAQRGGFRERYLRSEKKSGKNSRNIFENCVGVTCSALFPAALHLQAHAPACSPGLPSDFRVSSRLFQVGLGAAAGARGSRIFIGEPYRLRWLKMDSATSLCVPSMDVLFHEKPATHGLFSTTFDTVNGTCELLHRFSK